MGAHNQANEWIKGAKNDAQLIKEILSTKCNDMDNDIWIELVTRINNIHSTCITIIDLEMIKC